MMIGMRFPDPVGIARIASLMAVFLLCLCTFLYPHQLTQLTTGVVVPTAPKMEHSSNIGPGTPGDGHTLAGNYQAAAIEETETANKHPLNAKYLTALLLTVFFGITLWVLLGVLLGVRKWCRDRVCMLTQRRLPSVTCAPPREFPTSLLSVFLL